MDRRYILALQDLRLQDQAVLRHPLNQAARDRHLGQAALNHRRWSQAPLNRLLLLRVARSHVRNHHLSRVDRILQCTHEDSSTVQSLLYRSL